MSSSTGCRRRPLSEFSDPGEQYHSERDIGTKSVKGLLYHVSALVLWSKELGRAPENPKHLSATVASCSILMVHCVSGNVEA